MNVPRGSAAIVKYETCSRCRRRFPLDGRYLWKYLGANGFNYVCIECDKSRQDRSNRA